MSKENKKTNPSSHEATKDTAKDELQEWKNLALRLKADYENREKEIAKEKTALRGLVEENLICDFLPVLDNLNSAVGPERSDSGVEGQAWFEGIKLVRKQFEDVLHGLGVEKMELFGTEFDPGLAEAVDINRSSIPQGCAPSSHNKIVKVIVDGYRKGERVIRAGRVVVGE
ncbi:nucleotide exchange factor GrpE [Patescibacteria group bacterium]|nr:nucleotide exchange factor GrpE [Patescibacteria group bacterium]